MRPYLTQCPQKTLSGSKVMNKGGSNFGQSKVVQGTKDTNNEEKKLNKKKNHDNKGV